MTDLLESRVLYFLAVAEQGSISAAAKSLHVSQPSVSIALKKLEDSLSAQLLHRTARGVTLTEAGKLLLTRAREAGAALRAGEDEIVALGTEPRGKFQLGCHESLGTYCLPGFMGRFLERYPDIELSFFNANSAEIEDAIVERAVEIGLVVNSRRHADCVVRELFEDRVTFIVSRKLKRKRQTPAAILEGRPLFHVPSLTQTQSLLRDLADHELSPSRTVQCSSMELVKSLVLDGAGVGILPYRVATHGVAEGRLAVLGEDLPRFRDVISLVFRADAPMTLGLRTLVDALLAHGRGLEPLPSEVL